MSTTQWLAIGENKSGSPTNTKVEVGEPDLVRTSTILLVALVPKSDPEKEYKLSFPAHRVCAYSARETQQETTVNDARSSFAHIL